MLPKNFFTRLARSCSLLSFVALAVVVIVSAAFNPASAATLTVINTSDAGAGSLRNAIASAAPGDTINFSVTGTITLTTGTLSIMQNVTITGPGASSLTVSGNSASGVFAIAAGITINISGLTVSNGAAGIASGIFNNGGSLTLTNVAISGNTCWGSGVGGCGIQNINSGTATLTNVTVSGNLCFGAASFGCGIANNATLTLTNVTISGNSASGGPGGIYNVGIATLTNVTISDNPTGGIFGGSPGTTSLRNTIVANSPSGSNCTGTITSLGHNLDSANTCLFTGTGDLTNTNPVLGLLALNAPGTTQTYALLAGSPAIDKADPVIFPATDQRGITRPQGAAADIGAYEVVAVATVVGSIPTLSEWGMILLGLMLAGLGATAFAKRRA
jgi:hypothetical protein